jgi:hypothetical protein
MKEGGGEGFALCAYAPALPPRYSSMQSKA